MHEVGEKVAVRGGSNVAEVGVSEPAPKPANANSKGSVPPLAEQGLACAKMGEERLSAFWEELTPEEREDVGGQHALLRWQIIALRADFPYPGPGVHGGTGK
ncbi:MAG: hypothetical protein ACRECZ_08320 [Methylocella sp.]